MKMRVLGTGTAVPSVDRVSSSCLLSTGAGNILIDAGPSVVRRLVELGYDTDDVDAIVLTHFHPDHTVDLVTFLFACNYGTERRRKGLTLLGGRGIRRFFGGLARVYPWIRPLAYPLTVKALTAGTTRMGPVSVTVFPMAHRDESIGLRFVEGGRSIAFTGDTGYSQDVVRLASGADVLVAECSFPEEEAQGHMNLARLLDVVREAKPRRVIMSHLYPAWDGFRGALPAPLLLAEDGMEIEV